MKKSILIVNIVFLSACIILSSNNGYTQWVQAASGMGTNRTVHCLTANSNYIFAGTTNGIFVTSLTNVNWIQSGLNDKIIRSLAVNGDKIYAGTEANGIYMSTDNGTSWTQTALNDRTVYSIAVGGNRMFAGTLTHGVYISTNDGNTWTQTSLIQTVYSVRISNNGRPFAGSDGGIYYTLDDGISWHWTGLTNQGVNTIAISGDTIFAGTNNGVYRSTNFSLSWVQTLLNNRAVRSMVVTGKTIIAGTTNGVYLSDNGGDTWLSKNQGIVAGSSFLSLCISVNDIYAGLLGQSVYRRSVSEIIGLENISYIIPESFSLEQNFPNPFNPVTMIQFKIPKSSIVTMKVFNSLGAEVATIINRASLSAGEYRTEFDARSLPSGIYFYSLRANENIITLKMILIK